MDSEQLKKYGREEAKEHHVSLQTGMRYVKQHIRLYGDSYYKRLDILEKKLKRKK